MSVMKDNPKDNKQNTITFIKNPDVSLDLKKLKLDKVVTIQTPIKLIATDDINSKSTSRISNSLFKDRSKIKI